MKFEPQKLKVLNAQSFLFSFHYSLSVEKSFPLAVQDSAQHIAPEKKQSYHDDEPVGKGYPTNVENI